MALLLKNTAYNICLLIQLVFYFVPASEVTYQAEGISQAIYQSGWLYKLDRDMKIKALMIMRRARKPLVFTALGFAPINMETFTAVRVELPYLKLFTDFLISDFQSWDILFNHDEATKKWMMPSLLLVVGTSTLAFL